MISVFDRRGDGDPIVLLHGTGGSHAAWDAIVPLLEDSRDVLVPELPGCGDTPPFGDGVPASIAAYADTVEHWLDGLGMGTVGAVGNSLGGQVAFELAARGRAHAVVALSPTGFWTGSESLFTRTLVRLLRASAIASRPLVPLLARSGAGRRVLLGTSVARPEPMRSQDAAEVVGALIRSRGITAINRDANRERLGGERTVPFRPVKDRGLEQFANRLDGVAVTVAWAERDRFLPVRQAARARTAFPDAIHVVLEGAGHLSMWDAPAAVADLILRGTAVPAVPNAPQNGVADVR